MEDGQIKDIPLDSPIDTKSSDMIVPVDKPKFAHNRQRYQGHVLPTSLRYEHNGWAAGEQVYEFEFEGGRIPETGSEPKVELSRTRLNGNPAYVLSLYEIGEDDKLAKVYFNFSTGGNCIDIPDLNVSQPISGDRSIVTITGTFNDKQFSFKYNVVSEDIYDITTGFAVINDGVSSGITSFRLVDTTDEVNFDSHKTVDGVSNTRGKIILPSKLYNIEGNYELGEITSVEPIDNETDNRSRVNINNGDFSCALRLASDADRSESNLSVNTNREDIYIDTYAHIGNDESMPVLFSFKKDVEVGAQLTGNSVNKLMYIKDAAVNNEYTTSISGTSTDVKVKDYNRIDASLNTKSVKGPFNMDITVDNSVILSIDNEHVRSNAADSDMPDKKIADITDNEISVNVPVFFGVRVGFKDTKNITIDRDTNINHYTNKGVSGCYISGSLTSTKYNYFKIKNCEMALASGSRSVLPTFRNAQEISDYVADNMLCSTEFGKSVLDFKLTPENNKKVYKRTKLTDDISIPAALLDKVTPITYYNNHVDCNIYADAKDITKDYIAAVFANIICAVTFQFDMYFSAPIASSSSYTTGTTAVFKAVCEATAYVKADGISGDTKHAPLGFLNSNGNIDAYIYTDDINQSFSKILEEHWLENDFSYTLDFENGIPYLGDTVYFNNNRISINDSQSNGSAGLAQYCAEPFLGVYNDVPMPFVDNIRVTEINVANPVPKDTQKSDNTSMIRSIYVTAAAGKSAFFTGSNGYIMAYKYDTDTRIMYSTDGVNISSTLDEYTQFIGLMPEVMSSDDSSAFDLVSDIRSKYISFMLFTSLVQCKIFKKLHISGNIQSSVSLNDIELVDVDIPEVNIPAKYNCNLVDRVHSKISSVDLCTLSVLSIDTQNDNSITIQLAVVSKQAGNKLFMNITDEGVKYNITGIVPSLYISNDTTDSSTFIQAYRFSEKDIEHDYIASYDSSRYKSILVPVNVTNQYINGNVYQGIVSVTGTAQYFKYINVVGLYFDNNLIADHNFYVYILPVISTIIHDSQKISYARSLSQVISDACVFNACNISAEYLIEYCNSFKYDVTCNDIDLSGTGVSFGGIYADVKNTSGSVIQKSISNTNLAYMFKVSIDVYNNIAYFDKASDIFGADYTQNGSDYITDVYARLIYADVTYIVHNKVTMNDNIPMFTLSIRLDYSCSFVPPRITNTTGNMTEPPYIRMLGYKDGAYTFESSNDATTYKVTYNSNTQEVVLYYKDYVLPVENVDMPALRDNKYLRDVLGLSSFVYKNKVLDYLAFTRAIDTSISAKLYGAFSSDNNIKLTSMIDKKAVFNYTGLPTVIQGEHEFNLADFDLEENVGYLQCYSTDVNSNSLERKHLAKIDTKEEYQIIKQAWNTTTEVENYWWITEDKILYLTKDKFILMQKEDKLDHWNGDKWSEIKSYERTKFLPSTVVQYGVSNLNGTRAQGAVIWTLSPYSDEIFVLKLYTLLDTLSQPLETPDVVEYQFEIVKRNIGSQLNASYDDNKLYSYSGANIYDLLANARISTTQIADGVIQHFMLGIHADNNFNQWTISINLNNSHTSIVQGYGFVGVDGSLTGGEIPDKYFSISAGSGGFNDTVEDLRVLSTTAKDIYNATELSVFNVHVVGNENQQWYIDPNIDGIVSHLTFDSKTGDFIKHVLPISNNYTYCYESPSFITRIAGDMALQMKPLLSLIPAVNKQNQWIWNLLFGFIGAPLAYYINPKISYVNYLQQTFGQYAYVHYNSTSLYQSKDLNNKEIVSPLESVDADAITSVTKDELSFDIVTIAQEQDCGASPWDEFFYLLGTALTTALDYTKEKLKVNEAQNQSATTDKGKKYSQMFLKNVDSMMKDAFTSKSYTSTLSSEVTMLKTLDMFYSTSAAQKVCAGPGFVNHNFVAQCIAQSMVSTQLEANQLSMLAIFTPLTTIQMRLELAILKKTITFLQEQVKSWGGPLWTVVGVSTGTSHPYLASVFAVTAKMLELTYITIELAIPAVENILNTLGGNHITSTITNTMSNHNVQIEPKHRYGSNSEVFMWPCFDCKDNVYVREKVVADTESKPWKLSMNPVSKYNIPVIDEAITSLRKKLSNYNDGWSLMHSGKPSSATISPSSNVELFAYGDVDYRVAVCRGVTEDTTLPTDMACVIGTENFLPVDNFKNENISESEPVFAVPVIQDYMLAEDWKLSMTCTDGEIAWVSCKDTKLIDGAPSNVIVSDDFCGIAAPYTAIEIKRELSVDYLRPWAVTPNVLALNVTGLNTTFDKKMYHAFDGYGYRIVNWYGSSGMNKEKYTMLYDFQINDRFKRSNKLPPNQFLGNFKSTPDTSVQSVDKVFCQVMVPSENEGTFAGTIGEDKDVIRYSLPIFSEFVSTLPAIVKTLSSYKLAVVDGVTSLCTDLRSTQSAYKTSVSTDFNIGTEQYRVTNDYICSIKNEQGVTVVTELVATLGLTYIGATLTEAYFYSPATRKYYSYTGGANLNAVDMLERFRDIKNGIWDFVDHTVIMPCLATFDRLDSSVHDDANETDNIIIPMIANNEFAGEVTPPVTTIFNTDSWFRTLSLPAGLTFQGPNRCIINRFIFMEYMTDGIKNNRGKWVRVPKEKYHPFRVYREEYAEVINSINEPDNVNGWTHNPFLLVTSPLGINEEIDCLFEWEITFAWTVEMDSIYGQNDYVCVNIMSETMTPGGKVHSRPTHVYLTKELFTRTGNYGYYSFRYEGNNGIGNRERLHIWSDGYIAVSSIQVEYKSMTVRRQTKLTQYADIQHLNEF